MAHDVLERLLRNLRETRRVYDELIAAAERKREHIVNSNMDKLDSDLKDDDALIERAAELNAQRPELHRLCRMELDAPESAGTLKTLCSYMPHDWAERMRRERRELLAAQNRLQSINRVNTVLINNALDYMGGLLSALFDVESISAYDPRGARTQSDLRTRSLDARV